MNRKILFVEYVAGLIKQTPTEAPEQAYGFDLAPGVFAALLRFKAAGYELVAIGNQDSLEALVPNQPIDAVKGQVARLFGSQGIEFSAELTCPHRANEPCACRIPSLGLVRSYLAEPNLNREKSVVVGTTQSGLALAADMGLSGFSTDESRPGSTSWPALAHKLLDAPRIGQAERKTRETAINISVDLDREADPIIKTGIGFFDHMLEQLGKHGGFALEIACDGDLEVDEHHTVEDVALTLGQALADALGDKRGIHRYGFLLAMDEASAEVAIDLSGRAYFVFEGEFPREQVGTLPTELVPHFFRSLSDTLGAALHLRVRGENTHHMIEACFKGVARALRQAFGKSGDDLPSTKGQL